MLSTPDTTVIRVANGDVVCARDGAEWTFGIADTSGPALLVWIGDRPIRVPDAALGSNVVALWRSGFRPTAGHLVGTRYGDLAAAQAAVYAHAIGGGTC